MIITGFILSVLGVALLCWLLFALAVQALPLYIGAIAATLALQNGTGAAPVIVVGIVAAILAFGATQFAFAKSGSPYARFAVALLVTAPAIFAGYHATLGIARIVVSSEPGRQAFALLGSLVIGCLAFADLHARHVVRSSGSAHGRTLAIVTPSKSAQKDETRRPSI